MKENRNIQLLNTRDEVYSLSVNNILLHSMYYPLKEAYNFAKYRVEEVFNKKRIVVYGVGLGYHITELLKLIDKKSRIDLFDADEEIVEIAKGYGVLKEALMDDRINFLHGYSENLMLNFSDSIKQSDAFIVYKPELRVLPQKYAGFKEAMDRFEIGVIEFERHGKIAQENAVLNNEIQCNKIDKFYEKYSVAGKTVVIAAAGPSLSLNIEKLKDIREKVIIFAVGSALRTLMNSGIKPDMITIIDPQEIVYNQIQGYENLNIPLCFLSTASNLAVTKYNGPKFKFYNSKTEGEDIIVETGKSVATAALSIAIKGGAKSIIFIGQDLAYINNKAHCDGYVHGDYVNSYFNKKVEGVDGRILNTTAGWLYFKKWIEDKIVQNPQIKFINCSSGAKIKGTVEMKLGKIISYNLSESFL